MNNTEPTSEQRVKLPRKQEVAASLVAEDHLSDQKIAEVVKIAPATLYTWKLREDFRAAVEEYKEAFRKRILSEGIARLENRVQRQNEDHRKLRDVIADRAAAYADPRIPGGSTGLLVRQVKFVKVFELLSSVQAQINAGNITEDDLTDADFIATKQTRPVEEYAVDTGLLTELRQLEKHTAQELGQWIERSDQHVNFDVTEASDEELEAITQG